MQDSIQRNAVEERALKVSGAGALLLAFLGIGFAINTGSDAILLDGLFSGLGFVMALLTLKVSRLVRRPDDETFQFGYAHFAPMINVLKSLIMSVLCVFALLSAVSTLVSGGQTMAVGSAVIYAALATLIGAGLFFYLNRAAERANSVLVLLDAKAARLDMLLSVAVLASFVLGWAAMRTRLAPWVDYLDPTLVTILCLVALPVPLKILWRNGREALLLAPDAELQQNVKERIRGALHGFPVAGHKVRMLKLGNVLAVTLHLRPAEEFQLTGVGDLDRVRHAIEEALADLDLTVGLDVMFVGDMRLAR
jgi:cation diffusion facilitator family transporter